MNYLDVSVLFVEDEDVIRMVYSKLISPHVREFYEAENGEQGLVSYIKFKPDIVVTDIRMPVMNGLDMIKKIKNLNPSARIVLLSAYGESHHFLKAIEYGVRGFLLKPVESETFETLLTTLANEVINEKKIALAEEIKKKAEKAIFHNEQILKVISSIAETLLHEGFNDETIGYALKEFANATNVTNALFYEKIEEENSISYYQCRSEWSLPKVQKIGKQIQKLFIDRFPMKELASSFF